MAHTNDIEESNEVHTPPPTFHVDEVKKSIIMDGLNEVIERAFAHLAELDDDSPVDTLTLIATADLDTDEDQPFDGEFYALKWPTDGIPNSMGRVERLSLQYSHNLDSVAEYKDNESCHSPIHILLAVFDCIRASLKLAHIYMKSKDGHFSFYIDRTETIPVE